MGEDGEDGVEEVPRLDFLADDGVEESKVDELLLETIVLKVGQVTEQDDEANDGSDVI